MRRFHERLWPRALVLLVGAVALWPVLALPAPVSSAAESVFRWRPFLAPFHAVVLHFPIGFITVAFILEAYRTYRPSDELRRVTVLVVWLSLLSGIVAATFGWLRASGGGYDPQAVRWHRNFGLAVPLLTLATLAWQRAAFRDESRRSWMIGYRALLTGTLALIVVAGHFGGNLTHGSKYLVENAPQFVRDLLQSQPIPPAASPSAAVPDEQERFYRERVQPIFQSKCYECHGPDKHKGGFRLDQPELALRGGDGGDAAIVPGDPLGSLLGQLILLPADDDDAMPPSGKAPLTSEELGIVLDWIRRGAVFGARSPELSEMTTGP